MNGCEMGATLRTAIDALAGEIASIYHAHCPGDVKTDIQVQTMVLEGSQDAAELQCDGLVLTT
jgi:hypothetical protein